MSAQRGVARKEAAAVAGKHVAGRAQTRARSHAREEEASVGFSVFFSRRIHLFISGDFPLDLRFFDAHGLAGFDPRQFFGCLAQRCVRKEYQPGGAN